MAQIRESWCRALPVTGHLAKRLLSGPESLFNKGGLCSRMPRLCIDNASLSQCRLFKECGEVPEWSNGAVSKTVVRLRVPWVRIPPSPPYLKQDPSCGSFVAPSHYLWSFKPIALRFRYKKRAGWWWHRAGCRPWRQTGRRVQWFFPNSIPASRQSGRRC